MLRPDPWCLGAMVAGLLLRLLNLGGKSLWLDEAFNISVVKNGLTALWTQTYETHHPPLHFMIQKVWMQFGEGEFWLRLLPALCGAAAIPLVYLFGKKLVGRGAAMTAAGLVALSPWLIWYSQDYRPYSFVVVMALAAMTAALGLFLKPSLLKGIVFAIAMAAAFYTHYTLLALIPLQIWLLVYLKTREKIEAHGTRFWLAGLAAAGIALYPWLRTPAARAFFGALKTGSYPGQMLSQGLGISPAILVLIVIAAAYLVLVAGIHVIRACGEKAKAGAGGRPRLERAGPSMLAWGLWIVFLVLSVWPRGYSVKKQVILLVPFAMLLVGRFWPWEHRNRKAIAAGIALSLVFSLVNVFAVPKDEWKQAVAFLGGEYQAGDVIFLLPGYGSFPFEYYNRGKLLSEGIDASVPDEKISAVLSSGRRVWLVSNREKFVDPDGKVRGVFARAGVLGKTKSFFRVRVDLFTRGQDPSC